MARRYEYLLAVTGVFSTGTDYLWTGDAAANFDGNHYLATRAIRNISVAGGDLEGTESRLTIELWAGEDAIRNEWLADPGPGRIVVQQVVSTDDGMTWTLVPRAFSGRLTSPELIGDRYRIDVIDRYGDPLRPKPRYWSNEDQQARFPGDEGLKYMRAIESGVEVKWP